MCSLFLREYAETNATVAFFNSFVAAVANLANKIAGAAGAAPKARRYAVSLIIDVRQLTFAYRG